MVALLAAVLWLLTPSGGRWLGPQLDRVLGPAVGITLGLEGLDLALPGSLTCDRLHLKIKGQSFVTATNVAVSISLPALLKQTVRVTRVRADAASLVPTIPETVALFARPNKVPSPDPASTGMAWHILIEQIDCPEIVVVIWEGGLGQWGAEGLAFAFHDRSISVEGHAVVRHAAHTAGDISVGVDLAAKRLTVDLDAAVGTAFLETFHPSLEPFAAARAVVAMDCPFSAIAGRITAHFHDHSQLASTFAVTAGGGRPWGVAGELAAERYTIPVAWSQIALPTLDGSLQWSVVSGNVTVTNIAATSAGATATGAAAVDWETWLVSAQLATAGTEHYLTALQPSTAGIASNLMTEVELSLGRERPLELTVATEGDLTVGGLCLTTMQARATARLTDAGWSGSATLQHALTGAATSHWQFAASRLALTNLVVTHPSGELTGDLNWEVGSQAVAGALHVNATNLAALPKMPLSLSGTVALAAVLSVEDGAQQIDASAAFDHLGIKTPSREFEGIGLNGAAALNGGVGHWVGSCSGVVTRVSVVTNLVNLATLAGAVSLSNQFPRLTLAIEAPLTSLDFSLTGRPGAAAPAGTNRLTDLEIDSVLIAELPLAALNAFPQLVDHAFGGRVRVAATYGGRLGDFMPTGTLHMVDGEYAHIAGISLKKIEAEVRLDRGQATLVQARGYSGSRASCTITGGVQWATAPEQGLSTQLGVSLNRLPFANEGIRMLISGETTLQGEAGTYQIVSDLALDEAALDLDESLSRAKAQRPTHSTSETSSAGDLLKDIDVRIRAATPIKVVGLGLDSEWNGEMGVRKEKGKVVFTGGFKPRRGTYTVFTRPFRIESGEIRLGGIGRLTPVFDIKSEYSRGEVTVTARLHGDANDLDLELTSIPSMPQDEMLSWVLFGNDSSALTPLQGLKLAQVAAQLVGGPANLGKRNRAAETLSVDRVELREMSNRESSTSLVVGKQVSERVYMEFIHEVGGQAASNIYVEYELTPHFTVETTIGSRANNGVGANYKFDY